MRKLRRTKLELRISMGHSPPFFANFLIEDAAFSGPGKSQLIDGIVKAVKDFYGARVKVEVIKFDDPVNNENPN